MCVCVSTCLYGYVCVCMRGCVCREKKKLRERDGERENIIIRKVLHHSNQLHGQTIDNYHYLSTCAVISSNEFSGLSRDLISPLISHGLSAINSPANIRKKEEKRKREDKRKDEKRVKRIK